MTLNKEILKLEKNLGKLENLQTSFDYLRLSIASPKRIRAWAERELPSKEIIGEISNSETLNFRTYQPEINGLFCEKIFGPIKNWKCKCGKYGGVQLNKICEECNVELTEARVRRYRMGYINLSIPISHLWYFKGSPNYLCILLRLIDDTLSNEDIEDIIYFRQSENYYNLENSLFKFIFSSKKIKPIFQKYLKENIKYKNTHYGSEIIKSVLENIDLKEEIKKIRKLINFLNFKKIHKKNFFNKNIIQKLRILESFLATKTNPSWMILTVLPVLPPNLRPLLELENKQLISADINEIYRLIIIRNERLFEFIYNYFAPDMLTLQGRKLLQEAVDSLIDNSRVSKDKKLSLNNKNLKSLTDILEGKQGRFRQSLLGKRVDYSARSVIITNPVLNLNQCGLPFEIAKELFTPFLINLLFTLTANPAQYNIKLIKLIINKNKPYIWRLLELLMKKNNVLLNRAPTLHKFGIQSFVPVLILGQSIHLHPLVCTGFNADFDGDQMAVHLPLYESSQLEAKTLMQPSFNILSPSNGEVILKPTQDIVIGCYYLTLMLKKLKIFNIEFFVSEEDALKKYYQKKINLHNSILVKYSNNDLIFKIKNQEISFYSNNLNLEFLKKKIFIKKIYILKIKKEKIFLITNCGILIAKKINNQNYYFETFFLETTPGRILFNFNIKTMKKNNDYN
jgi:DNA-directed RNA polymerase subunit beta'